MEKTKELLSNMTDEKRHNILYLLTVYSLENSMNNHTTISEYTCTKNICDFKNVFNDICNNKKLGMADIIVKDIEKHQSDYLPSKVDGFIIDTFPGSLYIKNKNNNHKIVAKINCHEVHRKVIKENLLNLPYKNNCNLM